jgi:hypothetical protein
VTAGASSASQRAIVRTASTSSSALASLSRNLALGHSPSWFAAVGIPGNLLWLAGLIGLGRATARSRALPRWVAYALPLGLIALLPFGELGGSLLTAAVWGYVGVLLLDRM